MSLLTVVFDIVSAREVKRKKQENKRRKRRKRMRKGVVKRRKDLLDKCS